LVVYRTEAMYSNLFF